MLELVRFAVPTSRLVASLCFIWKHLFKATYTQQECQLIVPSYTSCMKDVEYLLIKDINFTSSRGMKRKLDGQIKSLGEKPDADTCLVNEWSKKVGSSSTITFISEAPSRLFFRGI